MASPQTAHGYTKVANAIMRALYRFPFSGQEMRLLLWVLRDSYGWREKQTHSAPLSRICDETGIPRATASWVVRKLVKGGVLVQVRGRSLRFNKDYDEWLGTAPDMLPLLAAAKAEAEPEESRRGSALKPPTAADVRAYCLSRNSPVDADKFWHHYEATNWMSGRSRVTNWKSMVCFWERSDKAAGKEGAGKKCPICDKRAIAPPAVVCEDCCRCKRCGKQTAALTIKTRPDGTNTALCRDCTKKQ